MAIDQIIQRENIPRLKEGVVVEVTYGISPTGNNVIAEKMYNDKGKVIYHTENTASFVDQKYFNDRVKLYRNK